MDQFIENFLGHSGFGPSIEFQAVPKSIIDKFRGHLPDKLLEYWSEHGWCGFGEGLLWLVNPDDWEDELEAWIGDTEFMERDAYHVYARTAFGELLLWGERTGPSLKISTPYGMLLPAFDPENLTLRGPDREVQVTFASFDKEEFDFQDTNGEPLFQRALQKLGQLDHNTLYGFVPALALGGKPSIDRLQKLDAHVHLDVLSQITETQTMRDIGDDTRQAGLN